MTILLAYQFPLILVQGVATYTPRLLAFDLRGKLFRID